MQIDWLHFTPWPSLAGGVLVGLSAAALLLFGGRTLGVSGIVDGALVLRGGEFGWRLAFLLGLLAAPAALTLVFVPTPPTIDISATRLAVAGLLVGFGARLGSGCTSGHGICGLSRLSPRSFVATLTFVSFGAATVFALRHLAG
jgi:uncharacterized membrane protein YedE/YeeE